MGVLDDLKKEAKALEAERERENTAIRARREEARAQVQPLMQLLYKYFSELKHHLEVVKKDISTAYEIKDVGVVDGLQQGQYGVATERPEHIDKFTFRCVCAKPGVLQVNQSDAASSAAYRDYLRDNGLKAKVRDTGKGSSLFMVQPAVPVAVEFAADYDRPAILLRLRNLNAIGVTRHTIMLETVHEPFMDELAKALLRVPNKFDQLIGISLTETSKVKLKKKIRAAMRQNELAEELRRKKVKQQESITRRFGRGLFGRKRER